MHLRIELSYRALREAYESLNTPRDFDWFTDLIESQGFQQSVDTCAWFAEPATQAQLELAAEIYGVSDPMALGEIGAGWMI